MVARHKRGQPNAMVRIWNQVGGVDGDGKEGSGSCVEVTGDKDAGLR